MEIKNRNSTTGYSYTFFGSSLVGWLLVVGLDLAPLPNIHTSKLGFTCHGRWQFVVWDLEVWK